MIIKIYQSGPIAGCNDSECMDWRQYLKDKYEKSENIGFDIVGPKVKFIDPMRRDMRHLESAMSSFEEQKKIVSLDKADIIRSDAMIVWTALPFPSAGTSMEIIYGFERGKYIITVNPRGVVLSPWVYYHSHKIVLTLDDAMENILRFFND